MDAAEAAVRETLARARRVFTSGAVTTLAILKEADADLAAELERIVAKKGGPTGTFTEASAQLYRKQIQLSIAYLEKRLARHTHTQAMKAAGVALRDTVKVAKALEKQFTGITRPLQLENQQMQDAALRGTGASLLRKHQSSFNRYGQAMVADFERVMRTAQLQGLTHEQIVSRMVEAGKHGGIRARKLHEQEPGYFPEPTSYVKRRYWAERIVRTELANAANATSLQGMNVLRETEFPDMQKKILAVMDARTAPDSIAVHGQVRKLEEMFQDGAGRLYLHPPARPNDRETIIPWRPHWKDNPATNPPTPTEQAKATVEAQPRPLGADRREQLRAAVAKAKARLLERKGEQKAAVAVQAAPTVKPAASSQVKVRGAAAEQRRAEQAARRVAREAAAAERRRQLEVARVRAEQERLRKAAERQRKAEERARKAAERQRKLEERKGPVITTNEQLLQAASRLGLSLDGDVQGLRRILGRDLRERELGDLTGARSLQELGPITGSLRISYDSIRYDVEAKGGSNVVGGADLARRITRKPDGTLEVYHSHYFTHESAQGGGVGGKVLRGMFQTYKDLGVKSVGVSAVDVGQYYWPKIGFVAGPDLVRSLKADFGYYLQREVKLSAEEVQRHVDSIRSARDIAKTDILGYKRVRTRVNWEGKWESRELRAGQDFLIHGSHESMSGLKLTLEDGDPGWEACQRELGLK